VRIQLPSCLPPHPIIAGLLLVTHFTLLLGMAAPVWLSGVMDAAAAGPAPASAGAQPPWVLASAGILIIGEGSALRNDGRGLAGPGSLSVPLLAAPNAGLGLWCQ
jgi:hypothetical protein